MQHDPLVLREESQLHQGTGYDRIGLVVQEQNAGVRYGLGLWGFQIQVGQTMLEHGPQRVHGQVGCFGLQRRDREEHPGVQILELDSGLGSHLPGRIEGPGVARGV